MVSELSESFRVRICILILITKPAALKTTRLKEQSGLKTGKTILVADTKLDKPRM